MPSVVHVGAVQMTVCRWGVADGGGGMVDVIPPASTFTVGVCLVLCWAFNDVVTGVVFFWGELRVQTPGKVCWFFIWGETLDPVSESRRLCSEILLTLSPYVSLAAIIWVETLYKSSLSNLSSSIKPSFARIGIRSSAAISRACSRCRSFR